MRLNTKTKRNFTNLFGGVAYFLCCLQWLLMVIVYSSFLEATLKSFTPTPQKTLTTVTPMPIDIHSNVFIVVIVAIFTIIVVLISLYVFIKIPSTIVKSSTKIVHKVAESSAPVLMHMQHVPETTQNRKKVTFRITIVIKALIVIAPLALTYYSQFTNNRTLDFSMSMYLAACLAVLAFVFFMLQYAAARVFAVHKSELW